MNKLSVVLYKNQPAVVNDRDGDKYIIKFCSQPASPGGKKAVYGEQKVREKDVVLLHEGPCTSLEAVLACDCGGAESLKVKLLEAYELLMSDESTASQEALRQTRSGLCFLQLIRTFIFSFLRML